jgi:hypothetical protein
MILGFRSHQRRRCERKTTQACHSLLAREGQQHQDKQRFSPEQQDKILYSFERERVSSKFAQQRLVITHK